MNENALTRVTAGTFSDLSQLEELYVGASLSACDSFYLLSTAAYPLPHTRTNATAAGIFTTTT